MGADWDGSPIAIGDEPREYGSQETCTRPRSKLRQQWRLVRKSPLDTASRREIGVQLAQRIK